MDRDARNLSGRTGPDQGYIEGAALTRDGLERTGILAVRADGDRPVVAIQVKAARENGSVRVSRQAERSGRPGAPRWGGSG